MWTFVPGTAILDKVPEVSISVAILVFSPHLGDLDNIHMYDRNYQPLRDHRSVELRIIIAANWHWL